MPNPFLSWGLDDAKRALNDARDPVVLVSERYYYGDHWQGGTAWVGPWPKGSPYNTAVVTSEIERLLAAKNCVKEGVDRHRNALLGREPKWGFTVRRPLAEGEQVTDSEQDLIDEAEAALTEWWDRRGIRALFQRAAAKLIYGGRGCLRLFVPRGLTTEDGQVPPVADLTDGFDLIFLSAPSLDEAIVVVDEDTQQRAGIFTFEEENREPRQGYRAKTSLAEITFADLGFTFVAIVDGKTVLALSQPLDLGGNLTIYQMEREALITEQAQQQQALVNKAFTMMSRNIDLGGFLERTILNAQMPGKWTTDPDTGEQKFIPDSMMYGAGVTNAFTGVPLKDETGRVTGYSSPGIVYRDPVSVQTFRDTIEAAYGAFLDELSQRHVTISRDATASGESRRQAMADFLTSLGETRTQIEQCGRWLLETSLALATQFAGEPGLYADLRAVFECQLDVGPVPVEENRLTIDLKEAKIISRETAMLRSGVDDPDAEAAKITEEQEEALARQAAAGLQPAPGGQVSSVDTPLSDEQGEGVPPGLPPAAFP